jgi:peptidylprolyl isomerase
MRNNHRSGTTTSKAAICTLYAALGGGALFASAAPAIAAGLSGTKPLIMSDVLAASKPTDWRPLDPANTLYLELDAGRVVIELAPQFAPRHIANIKTLVREHYFDGLPIVRVQDNFVAQWDDAEHTRSLGSAQRTLAPEFSRPARGLHFTVLPDPDTYAAQVGFVDGFPAARERARNEAWIVHCYGVVGVGRDTAADSGSGAELYAVIGHAPRQLDRNVTAVGRVVWGMERLASLPRGPAPAGFYQNPGQRVPIRGTHLAIDVPPAERTELEVLRTDTDTFTALIESRRNRRDEWYKVPAGRIDLCNVPIAVRLRTGAGSAAANR